MHNSLRGLIQKHTDVPFNNLLSILNDVGLGLQYLHSKNPPIVHRDLTPNNILLCYHLRAKITDLGVARILQTTDTKTLTQAPGTQCFMPPECLADKPVYGLSLDIFSFGGVIIYIATQQWPQPAPWIVFDSDTGKKIVLTELQRRQQYLDKMTGASTDLKPLVMSCLDDNPKNRPSVAKVLLDIKKAKNTYCQKFFSAMWGTKFSSEQQLTPQLPAAETGSTTIRSTGKTTTTTTTTTARRLTQLLQKREEEHQQFVQQKHDESQQPKEQHSPQVSHNHI